jgi:hypothetical protein
MVSCIVPFCAKHGTKRHKMLVAFFSEKEWKLDLKEVG